MTRECSSFPLTLNTGAEGVQSKVFGLVLTVIPFNDMTYLLELAGDSNFRLVGNLWNNDGARALGLSQQNKVGVT